MDQPVRQHCQWGIVPAVDDDGARITRQGTVKFLVSPEVFLRMKVVNSVQRDYAIEHIILEWQVGNVGYHIKSVRADAFARLK